MRLIAIVLSGCSFTHGSLNGDASGDTTQGGTDGANRTCYAQWLDHSIRFSTPVPIDEINTAGYERDPFVSADETALYFSSDRTGSMGPDIWVSTRSGAGWGNPSRASSFSSVSEESKLSITQNGLTAVVGSNRAGGSGGMDVWETTRTSTSLTWPAMTQTRLMKVETFGNDHDPAISADGLHLYLAPDADGHQHIFVASRASPTGNFDMPMTIDALDSFVGDADPSPTPDERVLLFASNRTIGGLGASNILYTTRTTPTGTFETPLPVPDINSDGYEGDPHVSADGCRVYFARYIGATALDWDLFVATAN